MRHRTRTWLALIAFVSLLGVWRVLERTADPPPAPAAARTRLFAAFSPSAVTRIVLSGPPGAITLERAAAPRDAWQLVLPLRAPADRQTVARLLAALAGLRLGDPVTARLDRHGALGVDQATATRVRLLAGSRLLADLFVGHVIDGHTMVRATNDAHVLQAIGDLPALTVSSAAFWRDHRIVDFAPDDARRLALDGPSGTLRLRRETATTPWLAEGATSAPGPDAVRAWLAALAALRAESFLDPADPATVRALAAPLARVRIELAAGAAVHGAPAASAPALTLTLARAPHPEDDGYLVRRDDRPQVYGIAAADALAITGGGIVVAPTRRPVGAAASPRR